ncbi:DMT family transporter [Limnohabitans sp.]|uniref:DMT family transporter n=1 Tax=Limnohabitans sp. TaxID=1907725 RepID=UPI0038B81EA8
MNPSPLPWRQWLPDFVLLALLWGSSFLFMREGAVAFGPVTTAWVRVLLAALMLTPVVIWRGEVGMLRQHWRHTWVVGVLSSGLPFVLYAYALLHISTGMSSILNATTPLFGALIAWFWLGERLNSARALGLALGFGGVLLLVSDVPGGMGFRSGGTGLAVLACLGATTCYGLAGSFIQRYLKGVSPMVVASGSLWGASVFLALPALWLWPEQAPSAHAWLALGAAGLLCTALAYWLYFRLISRTGPARALTVTYLIPVFANVIGIVLLDEVITHWMLLGGLVVIMGTALASGLVGLRRAPNL